MLRGSLMYLVPHELSVWFSAGALSFLFFGTCCYFMFCGNLALITAAGDFASLMRGLFGRYFSPVQFLAHFSASQGKEETGAGVWRKQVELTAV